MAVTPWERIDTERLWMRPFDPLDAVELHRLLTHPSVRRYLLDDEIVSRTFVDEEIARSEQLFASGGFGMWSVFLQGRAGLVGFCGFRYFHEPPELQLLYGFAPDSWNRGLATEAARAMIRRGFERSGFERIVASADTANVASRRVMEKAGMRFAKRLTIHGRDTVYYVIERE